MGAVVYGRRALRRFERQTGERIVWATGPFLTTVDHRHLAWTGERWTELEQSGTDGPGSPCGLGRTALASCTFLFGEVERGFTRGLMRGPCRYCAAGDSELHRWDCTKLDELMQRVNPDYWPRPVHRPMWLDDPRRRVGVLTKAVVHLALGLDVPFDLMMPSWADPPGPGHWSHWVRTEEP